MEHLPRSADEVHRLRPEALLGNEARAIAPDVSVVILNYNGRAWLDGCLRALERQAGPPAFEIIFVDNASHDASVDHVRAAFPPFASTAPT